MCNWNVVTEDVLWYSTTRTTWNIWKQFTKPFFYLVAPKYCICEAMWWNVVQCGWKLCKDALATYFIWYFGKCLLIIPEATKQNINYSKRNWLYWSNDLWSMGTFNPVNEAIELTGPNEYFEEPLRAPRHGLRMWMNIERTGLMMFSVVRNF